MVDLDGIKKTFDRYYIHTGKLSIDPTTGLISCTGSITGKWSTFTERSPLKPKNLRVKFGKIRNNFDVSYGALESIEGAPVWVGKNFSCRSNKITNLQGAPLHVGGLFACANNKLTSLEHCPKWVGLDFDCMDNQLTSLGHCPREVSSLFCMNNRLTSLRGAPSRIDGQLRCWGNSLESLEGMPADIYSLWIDYSPTLPLLRCLQAQNITWGPSWPRTVYDILKKYEGQGKRALFDCQKELEDAGFEDNARW